MKLNTQYTIYSINRPTFQIITELVLIIINFYIEYELLSIFELSINYVVYVKYKKNNYTYLDYNLNQKDNGYIYSNNND